MQKSYYSDVKIRIIEVEGKIEGLIYQVQR